MTFKKPVYLDHQATTPIDPLVLEVLERTQRDFFGNPSSTSHSFGWSAQAIVKKARDQVAGLINADPREIFFTSGATEANNIALLGTARASSVHRKIVSTQLEHSSVKKTLDHLAKEEWNIVRVMTPKSGVINWENIAETLDDETLLVSVIAAQNEIGTLQPLAEIGQACRSRGVLFHSDAAQAAAHVPLDVQKMKIDLLSLSAHKMYGPKGVGALWIRRCHPPLSLDPCFFGGGQEGGVRPGTLNVPGIAAFGEACRLVLLNLDKEGQRLQNLRSRFLSRLKEQISGVHLNGSLESRLPGNLNLRFEGLRPGQLLPRLTVLALSAGSACNSEDPGPSPVLLALGLEPLQAASSLRIGIGRFTSTEEVDFAVDKISTTIHQLRLENK